MKKIVYLKDGRFIKIGQVTRGIDEVAKGACCPLCEDVNQKVVVKYVNDPDFPNVKWWLACPVHGELWFIRPWKPVTADHKALAVAGAWFGR